MNTNEILNTLQRFTSPQSYIGVFPSNKLPKRIKKPAFIVANTHPASMPGEHWVAFYFPNNGRAEYFDSFGYQPINTNFSKFLNRNSRKYVINSERLQGNFSSTCGLYCCMFLYHRHSGKSLKSFCNQFSDSDYEFNDENIIKMFKNKLSQFGGLKIMNYNRKCRKIRGRDGSCIQHCTPPKRERRFRY